MTAKEMFEELGYEYEFKGDLIKYDEGRKLIVFNNLTKKVHLRQNNRYRERTYIGGMEVKLHKAIHQQMKELGWIE